MYCDVLEDFEDTKGVIRFVYRRRTEWPKEKGQKDNQRYPKHSYKTEDRVTRTPLKPGVKRRCSGMVSSSIPASGTRRVHLDLTGKVIEINKLDIYRCHMHIIILDILNLIITLRRNCKYQ